GRVWGVGGGGARGEERGTLARRRKEAAARNVDGPEPPEMGMEEISSAPEIGMEAADEMGPAAEEAGASVGEAATPPVETPSAASASAVSAGAPPPDAAAEDGLDLGFDDSDAAPVPSDDAVRDELLSLLETVLRPAAPSPEGASPAPSDTGRSLLTAPLFRGLQPEELTAVVEALKLRAFEPGEIVITEGEPKGSLFIITSGRVRAYVR